MDTLGHVFIVDARESVVRRLTPQYQLTTAVNPPGAGTVTAGGWFDAGTMPSISATANPGYQFAYFSVDLSGNTNPQPLTMNGPEYVVANFAALTPNIAASIISRVGTTNARVWTFNLTNNGLGAATASQITGVTLRQTAGAACTPAIRQPASSAFGCRSFSCGRSGSWSVANRGRNARLHRLPLERTV